VVKELRERVKKLLVEKEVELVIGWEKGSRVLAATPAFIDSPEEADRLIFDSSCGNNPAVYFTKDSRRLLKEGRKVGVVVKGCDGRSLALYMAEKQVKRENIVIIGVACRGVIDKNKVAALTGGREVLEYSEEAGKVTVKGRDFDFTFDATDVLSSPCLACGYPDAREYDFFIGEPRDAAPKEERYATIDEFEKLSPEERWEKMKETYSRCIRCYACRNVCPSCYCNECFVDQNDPQWIGKTHELTDTMIFHIIRNLHVAGRCVECGACERACPMGLDLLLLNRKVAREMEERFGYITGIDAGEKPAMADFREDEKQDFIMG
jgi:formate dehydrogenase subunit beta